MEPSTTERELIRDYIAPDGRVLRVVLKIATEALKFPMIAAMIERDFERTRDKKFAEDGRRVHTA